jgi:uncharacterized protein YjbJ (UPF0337 family)
MDCQCEGSSQSCSVAARMCGGAGSGRYHAEREIQPNFEHLLETSMDKDRVEGSVKQAKGAVKEAWGKVTGDAKTQAEGKADKAEGKVQNAVGGVKDKAREALERSTEKG